MRSSVLKDRNLQITFGVALIAVLRADSVTPAFPAIAAKFGCSSQDIGLLIALYALPSVFLTPVLGVLADRWGRKRVLVPSLLLFGIAGGLSGFVHRFEWLLALRLLHGIGAAALSMLNITLIADHTVGDERAVAMGYNASVRSFGSLLFPLLGGGLAVWGWQAPFALAWLALPVALLVALVMESPDRGETPDFTEYLASIKHSVQSWEVGALFVAGGAVFVVMFGGYLNYFPFVLEEQFQASAWLVGALISGRSVVNVLIASQLGRLTRWVPLGNLLRLSFLFYALAFILIPLVPSLGLMILATLVLGVAEGLYWPANQAVLGSLAPLSNRASFMAANDMVLKAGQTVGPQMMGAVFGMGGTRAVFYTAAAVSLATFGMLMRLLDRGTVRSYVHTLESSGGGE